MVLPQAPLQQAVIVFRDTPPVMRTCSARYASDIVVEGAADDPATDPADLVPKRSMSKHALIQEAACLRHKMSHFPHNPYCPMCKQANLWHKRGHRTTDKEDDGLPKPTGPLDLLSVDVMIVAKSFGDKDRIASSGNSVNLTVRNYCSGLGFLLPNNGHDENKVKTLMKEFAGAKSAVLHVIVKGDPAKQIKNAVDSLGWMMEPSLANEWPHSAAHERWIAIVKLQAFSELLCFKADFSRSCGIAQLALQE